MATSRNAGLTELGDWSPWQWLSWALAPTIITTLVVTVLVATVGPEPVPQAGNLVFAAATVLVVAALYATSPPAVRAAAFRYRTPTAEGLAAALAVAPLLPFVFDPVSDAVAAAVGAGAGSGTVETTAGAAILAVAAIVVAPITEEVLFRGLVFGALDSRYDARTAVLGSSLLFGAVHLFGGVSGVVFSVLSGLAFAWLRLRYDGLVAPGVAHAVTNAYEVAVVAAILPDVAPW